MTTDRQPTLIRLVPLFITLSLALTGCGGSSSSGGDTSAPDSTTTAANVVITEANSTQVAAVSVDGIISGGVDVTGLPTGVEVTSFSKALTTKDIVKTITSLKIPKMYDVSTGAEVTETANCSLGGSITVRGVVTNSNDIFATAGDYVSISASNCKERDATINGNLSLKVLSSSSDSRTAEILATNLTLTADLTANSSQTMLQSSSLKMTSIMSGGYQNGYFNVAEITTTSTGSMVLTDGVDSRSTSMNAFKNMYRDGDYADDGSALDQGYWSRYSADGLVSSTKNTTVYGAVSLKTLTVFEEGSEVYPRSGVLEITGKSGKVKLTVLNAQEVQIETDANNDGIYESLQIKTWNDLFATL